LRDRKTHKASSKHTILRGVLKMATKLEKEEYLYRRAIDIIESTDTDAEKEDLLFEEVWEPLALLYKDRIKTANVEAE
jgi:hypothetical protein